MQIVKNANIVIFVLVAAFLLFHWLRYRHAKAQATADAEKLAQK